jgi:hypothetical protein
VYCIDISPDKNDPFTDYHLEGGAGTQMPALLEIIKNYS